MRDEDHFPSAIMRLVEILDDEICSSNKFISGSLDMRSWLFGQYLRAIGRDDLVSHCRPATEDDYVQWLAGYCARGGKITNVRAGTWEDGTKSWFVLTSVPDTFPYLCGANAVHVIVPASLRLKPVDIPSSFHGVCGHSDFYFMEGFEFKGICVPYYTSTCVGEVKS